MERNPSTIHGSYRYLDARVGLVRRVGCNGADKADPRSGHHSNPQLTVSGANRYLLTLQSIRVSGSIPVLVMVPNHRFDGIWEVDRLQNVCANSCMNLHSLEFSRCERPRLVEMYSGTASFPVSWSNAAALSASSCFSSATPSAFASAMVYL